MADASIEIRGVKELMQKLGVVQGAKILEPPMERTVLRVEARVKRYPPAPRNSRYIRGYGFKGGPRTSETLGKRWTTRVRKVAGGVEGRIGNNASYAPLVQSARFQTAQHRRTGWMTDEAALKAETPRIVRDFEAAIEDALK